jgi:hypothetical protein
MSINTRLALLILAASAPTQYVAAETFDGSKALLCATVETIECGPREDCEHGSADSLRFPQFLQIDAQKKLISAVRPDGTSMTTTITSITELDDRLLLQGVENHLGWTISITRTTGHMAVAIAGNQIAFSVFGACMVR